MPQYSLTPSDLIVICGYFALVLLIGLYFRRRMAAPEDYFAGGHQIPWWLAGVSHYMSSFSAFSFIAYAQLGYTYGWVAVSLFWVTVPACVLGGLIFARRWRQARVITPVAFLERRFNMVVRQVFAWAGIPMKIFEDALKIFATSLFLALGLGISVPAGILACGLVTIAYTFLGGLWALVITDYVQFLMKGLAMLLLLPLALWHAGGWTRALHGLPVHFFSLTNGPYDWLYLVAFTILITISYNGSWALAQKYYSASDERAASKAAYLSAALNFLGAPLMILPAILGRRLLPDLLAQHRTADVYAMLVMRLLPPGMVGIIVAALFSATMATVSADFNAIAAVLTEDVYHRLLRPRSEAGHLVKVGRLITLGFGGLTIGGSLWIAMSGDEALFHLMVLVGGVFLAPSFLPLLTALLWKRLSWKGALAGYGCGIVSGLTLLALRQWVLPGGAWPWLRAHFDAASILINTGATGLGMALGSLALGVSPGEQERVADFFRRLKTPVEVTAGATVMPYRASIAWSTLGVGGLLAAAGLLVPTESALLMDAGVAACLLLLGAALLYRSRAVKAARGAGQGRR